MLADVDDAVVSVEDAASELAEETKRNAGTFGAGAAGVAAGGVAAGGGMLTDTANRVPTTSCTAGMLD